jgi:cell division protein ZipA
MSMEIGLRWILILISVAVLGLIVFDGWRRIKRQKKSKSRNFRSYSVMNPPSDKLAAAAGNEELMLDEYDEFAGDLLDETETMLADSGLAVEASYPENRYAMEEEISYAAPSKSIPETFFILNILAPEGKSFSGSQLLPALLSLGLRYGEMSIFHRHEHINGTGNILFSLASATEPGVFNLNSMESQQFYGLTMFLKMPGLSHPTNAINLMLQTTKRLAKMMDGIICDEAREPISESGLEQRYTFKMRQIIGRS